MSRRFIAAAALAVSAALLAGCSQQPGTAAFVEGERITENEVADASATFGSLLGSAPDLSALVDALIKEKLVTPLVAEYDLTASDEDVRAYFDAYSESQGAEPLTDAQLTDAGIAVGRYLMLMGEATDSEDVDVIYEEILASFQSADIEVSPRYGEFTEDGELVAITHPWLEPLATAAVQ